jgi:hypothetical protein
MQTLSVGFHARELLKLHHFSVFDLAPCTLSRCIPHDIRNVPMAAAPPFLLCRISPKFSTLHYITYAVGKRRFASTPTPVALPLDCFPPAARHFHLSSLLQRRYRRSSYTLLPPDFVTSSVSCEVGDFLFCFSRIRKLGVARRRAGT